MSLEMNLNMAPNKIVIYCSLMVLLVSLVSAEVIDYSDTSIYDSNSPSYNANIYSDANAYQSPDFYLNTNPNSWDYNMITDWSLVPADAYQHFNWNNFPADKIDQIPPENLDYRWLDFPQYGPLRQQMTPNQIAANFNHINNLATDVNQANAIEAIKNVYSVDIATLGPGAQIRDNVLSATFGNEGRVTFVEILAEETNPYADGTLEIDAEGNIIFTPPETTEGFVNEEFNVNPNDIVVVDTGERKLFYQSNLVQGRLTFDQGQIYLPPGTEEEYTQVEINGISVRNLDLEDNVQIYLQKQSWQFNPEEHDQESYIFMDRNSGKLIIHTNPDNRRYNAFRFRQNNPFFPMEENDGFILFVAEGTQINIEQRDEMIPLMTAIVSEGDVAFGMHNGRNSYIFDNNGFGTGHYAPEESDGHVPFALVVNDQNGDNIVGPEEEKEKIIFGNDGGLAIVPENLFQEELECLECSENIRNSEALLNYISNDLQELESLPITNNLNELDIDTRNRLLISVRNLPPEMVASASEIVIVPDEELVNYCLDPVASGCATRETRIIYLPESTVGSTLRHEYAHTYTVFRQQELNGEADDLFIDPLVQEYNNLNNIPDEDYERADQLWYQYVTERSIYTQIENIMGEEIDGRYQREERWRENIMAADRDGPWGGLC